MYNVYGTKKNLESEQNNLYAPINFKNDKIETNSLTFNLTYIPFDNGIHFCNFRIPSGVCTTIR